MTIRFHGWLLIACLCTTLSLQAADWQTADGFLGLTLPDAAGYVPLTFEDEPQLEAAWESQDSEIRVLIYTIELPDGQLLSTTALEGAVAKQFAGKATWLPKREDGNYDLITIESPQDGVVLYQLMIPEAVKFYKVMVVAPSSGDARALALLDSVRILQPRTGKQANQAAKKARGDGGIPYGALKAAAYIFFGICIIIGIRSSARKKQEAAEKAGTPPSPPAA